MIYILIQEPKIDDYDSSDNEIQEAASLPSVASEPSQVSTNVWLCQVELSHIFKPSEFCEETSWVGYESDQTLVTIK